MAEQKKIIMWALTYKCNANCELCYLKDYQQPYNDISENQYFEIAKKIITSPSWKPQAVWLTGGEPTILSFLPRLIKMFEQAGIPCVLNTNGIAPNSFFTKIVQSNPKGITISLDSVSSNESSANNGRTYSPELIIEKIKFINSIKTNYTILGTALVLTENSISSLANYALKMQYIGVQYISLNPIHGSLEVTSPQYSEQLKAQVSLIKDKNITLLPSDFYVDLICKYYSNSLNDRLPCPSLHNFFFIAPWGYVYPCSNEVWQQSEMLPFNILESDDWYHEISQHNKKIGWSKSTSSSCFGSRCIGCWKLYYDTIFS